MPAMPPLDPLGSTRSAPPADPPSSGGFAFGPFVLETSPKRLLRDGTSVDVQPRQLDLLHALVANAGQVLPKDALLAAAWGDVAVGDNSLERAVSDLRAILDAGDRRAYIRNVSRKGYLFVAATTMVTTSDDRLDIAALLAPHRAWVEGRALLETLTLDEIARARSTFEQLLTVHPSHAPFLIGLANANILQFESTRVVAPRDEAALHAALEQAEKACRLTPEYAEAWATLGFVLERTGARLDAVAALQRAAMLEPDNWLHHFRLASASWGEDRLRAARRTLVLCPHFPMAHLLAATVWVARGDLDHAERDVDAGLDALAHELGAPQRFLPVALHWLKGLLCLARGATDDGVAAFERELDLETRGHLYARECCANVWCAKAACCLRRGDVQAARDAFGEAITRVPYHPMAHAGLMLLDGPSDSTVGLPDTTSIQSFEQVMAHAAVRVSIGQVQEAVDSVQAALQNAPPGNTGWLIPLDPMLRVSDSHDVWSEVLATLRLRAR